MYIYAIYLLSLFIVNINAQCTSKTYNFNTNLNDIKIDYNKDNVLLQDNHLHLLLTKETGGTRISLDKIQYGSIETMMKVSRGPNIVSSFILMADNGDEIDFEFVGKDNTVVQTNFFYKGIPIYDKNAKFYNTFKDLTSTFNTYKILWTPDYYQWIYNDHVLRTLYKNATNTFPNSPSYIQFGIWLAQNSKWAGNGPNWSLAPFNISIHHIKINCDYQNVNKNVFTIKDTKPKDTKTTKTKTKSTTTDTSTDTTKTITTTGSITTGTITSTSTVIKKNTTTMITKNTITTSSSSTIQSTSTPAVVINSNIANKQNCNMFYIGFLLCIIFF